MNIFHQGLLNKEYWQSWLNYGLKARDGQLLQMNLKEFPGDPVARFLASTAEGMCSIPGWETKISHVHSMAEKKTTNFVLSVCSLVSDSLWSHGL